jgi:hypothetical protein
MGCAKCHDHKRNPCVCRNWTLKVQPGNHGHECSICNIEWECDRPLRVGVRCPDCPLCAEREAKK